MKTIRFETVKEILYHETMPNGLNVYVLPKQGFHKTYATFTTKYGSIDRHFTPLNQHEQMLVPDGIAHFLEHKMFEKEEGDVFHVFSKQGAQANAFTSFNRTAYLFSCTNQVEQNVITLLDFVQTPYFTEQTVEKEKGIIGQEIQMYNDNPDWRGYFGLIENFYYKHPVKIDIAGTTESISHITKDLLYTCYETFYHPSNMLLFIVGSVNPEEIIHLVKDNQAKKSFKKASEIERFFENEPQEVREKHRELHMPVQLAKCYTGFKEKQPNRQGQALMNHELGVQLLLDLMFSSSSEYYQSMYDDGLIDETFSYDYTEEYGFGFAMIGGDTKNSDQLAKRIQEIVRDFKQKDISEHDLDRVRNKKIGQFLRALNSPEFIANQFTRYQFNDMNLFDVVPALEQISRNHLLNVRDEFFDDQSFSTLIVKPKS